jgi:isopentenyl phosphate kinase
VTNWPQGWLALNLNASPLVFGTTVNGVYATPSQKNGDLINNLDQFTRMGYKVSLAPLAA